MSPKCGRRLHRCRECKFKFEAGDPTKICPRCNAERLCRQSVREEGLACRLHGGASLKGIAHPNFKTGMYSEHMPRELDDKHTKFINDPNWLSLTNELAVLRAIMARRLDELDGYASAEIFAAARSTWREAKAASDRKDSKELYRLFTELGNILERGER